MWTGGSAHWAHWILSAQRLERVTSTTRPFGRLSVDTDKESSISPYGTVIHVMPIRHNAMHIRYATQRQHIIDSVRMPPSSFLRRSYLLTDLPLLALGSLIRCSTNSTSYPFCSRPPSSPSACVQRDNSSYPTRANSVPSAHCASALPSSPCSTRTASGTTLTWARRRGGRPCWILSVWVRLSFVVICATAVKFTRRRCYRIHTIAHAASPARSPHHNTFGRRHDARLRSHLRACGDESGHPRHTRPNTRF